MSREIWFYHISQKENEKLVGTNVITNVIKFLVIREHLIKLNDLYLVN